MLNLKFVARQCQIKLRIAQQPLTCSGVGGGFCLASSQLRAAGEVKPLPHPKKKQKFNMKGSSFVSLCLQLQADRSESASSSYECGARSKGKGHSTLASLRSLPSPYGLETASLAAFGEAVARQSRSKKYFAYCVLKIF